MSQPQIQNIPRCVGSPQNPPRSPRSQGKYCTLPCLSPSAWPPIVQAEQTQTKESHKQALLPTPHTLMLCSESFNPQLSPAKSSLDTYSEGRATLRLLLTQPWVNISQHKALPVSTVATEGAVSILCSISRELRSFTLFCTSLLDILNSEIFSPKSK